MSDLRLRYFDLSPELMSGIRAVKKGLEKSPLGLDLIELIYLRISQVNGCALCLMMHARSLRERGEKEQRIDALSGWRASSLFTPRERAALTWSDALTDIARTTADDVYFQPLKEHFSDVEISDLTFALSLMSALKRLAITMRQ
jgi:AhpD family alkylhydroperoxidase